MTEELGWQDLANRRRETRLALFYKIINEQVNVPHNDILKQTSTSQITRQGKTGKKYIAIGCKKMVTNTPFFLEQPRIGMTCQILLSMHLALRPSKTA